MFDAVPAFGRGKPNLSVTCKQRGGSKDFRSEMEEEWETVYPSVRARMDMLLTSSQPVVFEGTGVVWCSKIGWFFAQIARLFGAPLLWKQGKNVTIRVTVAPTKDNSRCWQRDYVFPDGACQRVLTSKVIDERLGFIDAVGAEGERLLATKMQVWAEGKSLFFASSAYFLRFKYFNLLLPALFTPGRLFAEHRDLGNGYFQYTIKFTHPLWGATFFQDGVFRRVAFATQP